MWRWVTAGFGVFYIAALGLVGQAAQTTPAAAKALKNPTPATDASIAAGKAVFVKYCQTCHGPEGKGDGPGAPKGVTPANFTDAKWDHGSSDGEIFTTIKDGVPPKYDMDSWDGRIKDPDIWNLVNYVKTFSAKAAAKK